MACDGTAHTHTHTPAHHVDGKGGWERRHLCVRLGKALQVSEAGGLLLLHAVLALLEVPARRVLVLEVVRLLVLRAGGGVGTDGGVARLVHGLQAVSVDALLDVRREVRGVLLGLLLLQLPHVLGDVLAKDAVAVDVGVVLLVLPVVAREALLGVRDVEAAVGAALEGTEHARTRRGVTDADVKEGAEGAALLGQLRHVEGLGAAGVDDLLLARHNGTVYLLVPRVQLIHPQLVQQPAGTQQPRAVRSGVVLEARLDTVPRQLAGVRARHHAVASDLGVDDLADDRLVGEAHNEPVAAGHVLVLVHDDQALAGTVVRLALAAPAVLGLEPLEVGLVLHELDEGHGWLGWGWIC
mmetsp:Transcript_46798/g.61926  ORF Transcript_46798/g.61926 Transcript_46798/m.61926 type:complete len:353 (-) Transcript_46798:12-1070(-)